MAGSQVLSSRLSRSYVIPFRLTSRRPVPPLEAHSSLVAPPLLPPALPWLPRPLPVKPPGARHLLAISRESIIRAL